MSASYSKDVSILLLYVLFTCLFCYAEQQQSIWYSATIATHDFYLVVKANYCNLVGIETRWNAELNSESNATWYQNTNLLLVDISPDRIPNRFLGFISFAMDHAIRSLSVAQPVPEFSIVFCQPFLLFPPTVMSRVIEGPFHANWRAPP